MFLLFLRYFFIFTLAVAALIYGQIANIRWYTDEAKKQFLQNITQKTRLSTLSAAHAAKSHLWKIIKVKCNWIMKCIVVILNLKKSPILFFCCKNISRYINMSIFYFLKINTSTVSHPLLIRHRFVYRFKYMLRIKK